MSFKKYMLRSFSLLLTISLIATIFTGCGEKGSVTNPYRSVNGSVLESQTLASNSNYELLWDNGGKAVLFRSINSENYWSDILYDAFLEGSTSANGNSPISITVVNTKTLKWDTVNSYSEMDGEGSVLCKKIDGGIRVTYFFDTYKIAIPVDYILRDDSLDVSVDSSKILEDGTEYKLVSISLVPYLCSVKNEAENGSIFVPSGSGAIMYSAETTGGTREYSGEVYGRDASRRNPRNLVDSEDIKIPVFGAYGDSKGIMGIIKQGAGSATIDAKAGNDRLGYSNVGVTFYVRGYDEFIYTYHGKYQGITQRVNKDISGQVLSVSYYPLYGEEANYSGIAQKYRNYLIESENLSKNESVYSAYAITLLGGTNITTSIFGIPKKKLVPLTTFEQASDILTSLKSENTLMPIIRMSGYGDNGVRTGSVAGGKEFSSAYGNKNELRNFLETGKDTILFFDFDIVNFSKSGLGFSLNFDVAKTAILHNAEHFPVSPLRVNDKDNSYYTISRDSLSDAAELAFYKAENYGIGNVSFSSLGSTAFSDFSDNSYINKYGIENDVSNILSTASNKGYKTAVADANTYAACSADILFDIETSNGDYDALDLEIPFYQMVFHSYKPMYTPAVNLEGNTALAIAKAAAYGMGLGYTLSYSYEDESDDLDEFALYGTVFADNKDEIHKTLIDDGYIELYSAVEGAELISYELGENGVSKTVYNNGKVIYVNQTNNAVDSSVGKLESYAFFVSEEG